MQKLLIHLVCSILIISCEAGKERVETPITAKYPKTDLFLTFQSGDTKFEVNEKIWNLIDEGILELDQDSIPVFTFNFDDLDPNQFLFPPEKGMTIQAHLAKDYHDGQLFMVGLIFDITMPISEGMKGYISPKGAIPIHFTQFIRPLYKIKYGNYLTQEGDSDFPTIYKIDNRTIECVWHQKKPWISYSDQRMVLEAQDREEQKKIQSQQTLRDI